MSDHGNHTQEEVKQEDPNATINIKVRYVSPCTDMQVTDGRGGRCVGGELDWRGGVLQDQA